MPDKLDTTHALMENELVLYRRERSTIWQCRYKVDGTWQRASTKQRDLEKAKKAAKKLWVAAEVRKDHNLPVITRKFRHVAQLAIRRMKDELAAGQGKVSYTDYERVIEDYLVPFFGVGADSNLSHRADRILSQGWKPTLSWSAVDKCSSWPIALTSLVPC